MTENEKLRALLTEARERIGFCECGSELCEHPADMVRRIDAALAEPVEAYEASYDDAYCLADGHDHKTRSDEAICSLRFQLERARRERDEARAEVERLRAGWDACNEELERWRHEVMPHTRFLAFQRGAEAMREAAAKELDRLLTLKKATAIWVSPDEIRALPVPKDK